MNQIIETTLQLADTGTDVHFILLVWTKDRMQPRFIESSSAQRST